MSPSDTALETVEKEIDILADNVRNQLYTFISCTNNVDRMSIPLTPMPVI